MDKALQSRISDALKQISAHDLQALAEEMACIKFPDRFNSASLVRAGRNDQSQHTKGWPDAYVVTKTDIVTATETVDGIEATREKQSWESHLRADLKNLDDDNHVKLSGYFFVGGYPDHSPPTAKIREWIRKFAAKANIEARLVSILIGDDLVLELMKPEYARIRLTLLGISSTPQWFRLLGYAGAPVSLSELFQPSQEEFSCGKVQAPTLFEHVLSDLRQFSVSHVIGTGAAGKTTLAELVCRSPEQRFSPTWYIDLSQFELNNIPLLLDELVRLSGNSVLFVVDNTHISSSSTSRIYDHWQHHSRLLGTRLLFLGRETHGDKQHKTLAVRPRRVLRAGFNEMLSIVQRLSAREGRRLDTIPQNILSDWAQTFGGSRSPTKTAVDLIAFSAALQRKLHRMFKGDLRLEPADAVDGIRTRYLAELGHEELENLLRLSALSQFEISVDDGLLADSTARFEKCVNNFGIVIRDAHKSDGRSMYRLVHAALGKLILEASPCFDVAAARTGVTDKNIVIGLRMLAYKGDFDGKQAIAASIQRQILSGEWSFRVQNFYDLGNAARFALQCKLKTAAQLDEQLSSDGSLQRLLDKNYDLASVNAFLAMAFRLEWSHTLALVRSAAERPGSRLAETITLSKPMEVATLTRWLGKDFLAKIDPTKWNSAQKYVPPDTVSIVVSAALNFERKKAKELVVAPCRQVVTSLETAIWIGCDLAHLSHVLRMAACEQESASQLVQRLAESGWLEDAPERGSVGDLSGALMSFANYLPFSLRPMIMTSKLEKRVHDVLQKALPQDPKQAALPICLLGSYTAIGGRVTASAITRQNVPPVNEILRLQLPRLDKRYPGMYELQLWLGIKVLAGQIDLGTTVDSTLGTRMIDILKSNPTPTKYAEQLKNELVVWLENVRSRAWQLS